MQSGASSSLPPVLLPLLWDVDSGAIDLDAHRSFLIGRILSAGPLESIRWARQTYGDDVIREWIVVHEGRQLSSPQIRLWETLIGLPAEAVAAWLAVPERRIWEGRATLPSQDPADCYQPRKRPGSG